MDTSDAEYKLVMRNNKTLYILFLIIFAINALFVFADDTEPDNETDDLKYILSLDTDITLTALRNFGYGIGINYEYKLFDFFSVKPGFGHMVCFSDMVVTTVNIQLFLNYYPLGSGLDKLFIGLGNGCDFIMYPGDNDLEDDTAIFLTPLLGWKWKITKNFIIEPFIGWKFYVYSTNNNENVENYLNKDLQWGLNIKIIFPGRKT